MIRFLRNLRRRFFNYGTIMKTFRKAERQLNKYRAEMLDEAREYREMIAMAEQAKLLREKEATRVLKTLSVFADITLAV